MLIIDIFEHVYLSQYIFLYEFAAMIALVHMRTTVFSLIFGNGKLHFSLGVTCYKVLVTTLQILVANIIEAVKLTSRLKMINALIFMVATAFMSPKVF